MVYYTYPSIIPISQCTNISTELLRYEFREGELCYNLITRFHPTSNIRISQLRYYFRGSFVKI